MEQQDDAAIGRDGDAVKGNLGHSAWPSLGHNARLSFIVRGKGLEDFGFRIADFGLRIAKPGTRPKDNCEFDNIEKSQGAKFKKKAEVRM